MLHNGGMFPHAAIHSRRHDQWATGRQQHGGEHVIRQPNRGLGQEIGGRRRDNDGMGALRHGQMFHLFMILEEIGRDRFAGQHFKCQRRHEFRRAVRHHDRYRRAVPFQCPQQTDGLEGRDAAGHA